jgi:hypothetical protein
MQILALLAGGQPCAHAPENRLEGLEKLVHGRPALLKKNHTQP